MWKKRLDTMAKPPHIGDERVILPDFRGTGFTRKIQVHDPELCMSSMRATIAPCLEALIASLRMTTIQRCRVLPGTAWRVDDAPQAWRTGDDRAEQSLSPVDR